MKGVKLFGSARVPFRSLFSAVGRGRASDCFFWSPSMKPDKSVIITRGRTSRLTPRSAAGHQGHLTGL